MVLLGSMRVKAQEFSTAEFVPGELTITAYNGGGGAVIVPGTIGGLPVVALSGGAFYQKNNVTSVTIMPGVKTIGNGCFYECRNLTSVTFPASLERIFDAAFAGCTSLANVSLSSGLISIESSAFMNCVSLTGLVVPDTVTTLGNGVFYGCSGLTSITLAKGLVSVDDNLFYGCSSLTSVSLPPSLSVLGAGLFYGCSNLASVSFGNGVTTLPRGVFYGTKLASYTVPDQITTIEGFAFGNCKSLTGISIADKVTTIEEYAFTQCDALASVTMPRSLLTLGYGAFARCVSLSSITIPRGVTEIGERTFEDCVSLNSVVLSNNLRTIGVAAFQSCSALASVTIPESVTLIDAWAFNQCGAITRYDFLGNAPAIGTFPFMTGTVHYYEGTAGWGSTFGGRPTSPMPQTAPVISEPPQDLTQIQGKTAILGVTATGGALSYQWYKDDVLIPGATTGTLTLPNVQLTGSGAYRVVVTNGAGTASSGSAILTVSPLPQITGQPTNQSVIEGDTVTFSVAAQNGPLSYQWTVNDQNISGATGPELVLNQVLPASAGTYRVVVTNPNGSTISDPASLVVNAKPIIDQVSNLTMPEDGGLRSISFSVSDAETTSSLITVSATVNNTTLFPTGSVSINTVSAGTRQIRLTPAANQHGTASVTLMASDGVAVGTRTFTVTVSPVNDAPVVGVIANQNIVEDSSTGTIAFTLGDVDNPIDSLTVSGVSSNANLVPNANIVLGGSGANRTVNVTPAANQSGSTTITISANDGSITGSRTFTLVVTGVNDAPTIANITDRTITEDGGTGVISFTIGDLETSATSLSLSKGSSNTVLVPTANIVFGGSGANRTVMVTPAANQSGTATISITVSDGTLASSDSFVLNVTAVNDAPTMASISNRSIAEDTSAVGIPVIIGDVDSVIETLSLSGNSSNTLLVPSENISFGGSGSNRTVTLVPVANQSGSATITLTVGDGLLTATRSFVLTVTAVNDAPVISDIGDQAIEEDVVSGPISFTLNDLETSAGSLTLSANSSNSLLVPAANVVFGGSGANRTVTITPAANQNGTTTISVTVSDGSLTSTDTFVLTVNPVVDPAVVTLGDLAASYDGGPQPVTVTTVPEGLAFSVTYNGLPDVPIELGAYTVEVTVNDPVYSGVASGTLVISKGHQQLAFTPVANRTLDEPSVFLHATAQSGLAPEYSVVSGPATLAGATLTLTGVGLVVVQADQPGDSRWNAAAPVQTSFHVFAGRFDQEFVWAKGFGGAGTESAGAVVVDATGNSHIAADFSGSVVFGSTSLSALGSSDIALLKLGADGSVLSATRLGGANFDAAKAIALDPAGGVVLAGEFLVSTVLGGATHNSAGSKDISLVKLDSQGAVVWSRRFGGTLADSVYGLSVDADGNILIAGDFSGSIGFGGSTLTSAGGRDGFVAKIDSTGSAVWAVKAGGVSNDSCYAVTVAPDGRIAAVGSFSGTSSFGPYSRASTGGADGFSMMLSSGGLVEWASRFGGSSNDSARAVAVDLTGAICVAGNFAGTDAGFGNSLLSSEGGDDVFVTRLAAADGGFLTTSQCGGAGADAGLGIAADRFGSLYLTGSYSGLAYFGGEALTTPQGPDCFVAKLSLDGGFVWALDGAGAGEEKGNGISVNAAGQILVAGNFAQSAVFGAHSVSGGGGVDLFVAKVNGPTPTFGATPAAITVDTGGSFSISMTAIGVDSISYQWFKGEAELTGETSATLQVATAATGDSGFYRVVASNPYGSTTSSAVQVSVRVIDRVLKLEAPLQTEENRSLEVPVYLDSVGEVTGLTLELPYNRDYLRNAGFEPGPFLVISNSSVIVDSATGTIRVVASAFPGAIPAGRRLVGTFRFKTRSVPDAASVTFQASLVSISDLSGNPLGGYTQLVNATTGIVRRSIPGDANNNGRLDVSDAAELIRLHGSPSQIRTWDHYLNDLNGDALLTEGDATRVLRVVTGLDATPAFPSQRVASAFAPRNNLSVTTSGLPLSGAAITSFITSFIPVDARTRLVLTRLNAGQILAEVYLENIPAGQAGISFRVDYASDSLRIASAASLSTPAGAMPAGVVPTWNVYPDNNHAIQTGSVSFAAAWNSGWTFGNGPVASLVFEIQAALEGQAKFPITLAAVDAAPFSGDGPSTPLAVMGNAALFTRSYADWALAWLGDSEADPAADADFDGFSNRMEYAASTDPADSASFFKTTSSGPGVSGFVLRWFAAPGVTYQVWRTTDFSNWIPVGSSLTGSGAEVEWSDGFPASGGGAFYRVGIAE